MSTNSTAKGAGEGIILYLQASQLPQQWPAVFLHELQIEGGILKYRAHVYTGGFFQFTAWETPPGAYGAAQMAVVRVAAAAAINSSLQIVVTSTDGLLYHAIRYENGIWSGFGQITGVGWPNFAASDFSVAVNLSDIFHDGQLQLMAIGVDHKVYHRIRSGLGYWTAWGVAYSAGDATSVSIVNPSADCYCKEAATDDRTVSTVVTTSGQTLHATRDFYGAWTSWAP